MKCDRAYLLVINDANYLITITKPFPNKNVDIIFKLRIICVLYIDSKIKQAAFASPF